MNKEQVKKFALENGFKLKTQPDGNEDLNPYVYDFANSLEMHCFVVLSQAIRKQHKYFLRTGDDLLNAVENEIFKK